MAIELIDPRTCIGCGTGVETCPTDVIRMNNLIQPGRWLDSAPADDL